MSQAEAQNAKVGLPYDSILVSASVLLKEDVNTVVLVQSCDRPRLSILNKKKDFELEEEDWDSDPENARNWSSRKKWTTVFVVSTLMWPYPIIRY